MHEELIKVALSHCRTYECSPLHLQCHTTHCRTANIPTVSTCNASCYTDQWHITYCYTANRPTDQCHAARCCPASYHTADYCTANCNNLDSCAVDDCFIAVCNTADRCTFTNLSLNCNTADCHRPVCCCAYRTDSCITHMAIWYVNIRERDTFPLKRLDFWS